MTTPTDTGSRSGANALDSYFKISERGSTIGTELRGGLVTFFTMAYIIVLNPLIIGFAPDEDGQFLGGGDAPNLALIAAATALVAGVMTILMGVVANYPLALATGLGLNAFVAFSIASEMTWADAMGLVVLGGHHHLGAGHDRLPEGGLPRDPVGAEDRDQCRDRAVHRTDRVRRRRVRPTYRSRTRAGRARHRRHVCRAGRSSSSPSASGSWWCSTSARSRARS